MNVAAGARWDLRWRRQRAVTVEEPIGVGRVQEPVEITLDVASQTPEEFVRSLRVVARDPGTGELTEIPSQVGNVRAAYGGIRASILFEASVPAHATRDFLVCYDNPSAEAPAYPSALAVRAPASGLGYDIRTAHVEATLDPKSGQMATFQPLGTPAPRFNYRSDPVHWTPDVVPAPPRQSYYNVRRWDPPARVKITTGSLAAIVERSGPLAFSAAAGDTDDPGVPEVEVSITYGFHASEPYVVQTSAITALADVELHTIRNGGELTYGPGNFTHAVWEDESGELMGLPLGGMADRDIDARHGGRIPATVPWFSFVNRDTGTGMAVLYLRYENLNPRLHSGLAPIHNDGIWIYSAVEGDFYFRAPIWEYALYDRERSPAVLVPAGSLYYERNAWLPFEFAGNDFEAVRAVSRRLRNPLRASYAARDDREIRNMPETSVMPVPIR